MIDKNKYNKNENNMDEIRTIRTKIIRTKGVKIELLFLCTILSGYIDVPIEKLYI